MKGNHFRQKARLTKTLRRLYTVPASIQFLRLSEKILSSKAPLTVLQQGRLFILPASRGQLFFKLKCTIYENGTVSWLSASLRPPYF